MGAQDSDVFQEIITMLNVSYVTNRRVNRIEWFFDSLYWQWEGPAKPIKIIVIDFYADEPGRKEEVAEKASMFINLGVKLVHVTPKPTVWQGKYRLTKRDYFAASNARNTAICLAEDGYLAFVDDVSVLMPNWLARVRAAETGGYVACGTYEKVRELEVKDGRLKHKARLPEGDQGIDHRIIVARKQFKDQKELPALIPCSGSWFFGCSNAVPVEAYLQIGGFDENCDSMGSEDYPCGFLLEKAGYKLFFDPAMRTVESEELHHSGETMLRIDKPNIKGHRDGSNAYLAMLLGGMKYFPNYFGEGGIRVVRQRVLAGEPFPITQCPQHDWRDGKLLSEM